MKKILLALFMTSSTNVVMAQSTFEGFYVQLATGYENNTVKSGTSNDNIGTIFTNPSVSSGVAPLVVGAGYSFNVSPKYTLGLGIDYSLFSTNSGTITSITNTPNVLPNTAYTKVSNRYNIYVVPGYVIDETRLAYLKVGYSNQKVEDFATSDNVSLGSANLSGYILGVGYKQMIGGGMYAFGEASYMNYSNGTLIYRESGGYNFFTNKGSSAYNALLGLGYKF